MSPQRRLLGAAAWALGLASAAIALHLAGRGPLAAPPLAEPQHWADWVSGRDPVVAAFAVVRVAAIAALWYLAAVTLLGLGLRLLGAVRMVAVADRFTAAPVRRMLAGTVSLGLAASGVMAIAGPAMPLPVAAAAQPATPPSTPPTTRGGDVSAVTMRRLAPTEAVPSPANRSPDRWRVAPGQSFWSIAESVLAAHLGRAPSDAEIAPYWRRLIEANRSALAHRDVPDLIFPGQVFEVPAP